MDPTDVARVLDCCDAVLGSTSLRGHIVADVPVDGYWPALAVAAIVVDGKADGGVRERLGRLDAAGIKGVAVRVQLARRRRETALRQLREAFDEDPPPRPETPLDPARARPVLSALLGASALARRAARAGDVLALDADELEALGVLAAEEPDGDRESGQVEGLAAALAVTPEALSAALARLEDQGLVRSERPEDMAAPSWRLTDPGRSAVAAWLARCDSLLPGWPPPPPRDVDDLR